ncbi:hypothetical protein V6N11_004768 [Hibiscus sabdariffa]|uniref:Uncharacterized protein n=1 Tax=Hibiscus sabdariffa TaxID=183260 RepID=A0ABR2SHB0_9ROSI
MQGEDPFGYFHVHGAVEGSRASCEGVLMVGGGIIRALFSGPINCGNRILAGIAAARTAVDFIIAAASMEFFLKVLQNLMYFQANVDKLCSRIPQGMKTRWRFNLHSMVSPDMIVFLHGGRVSCLCCGAVSVP